MNPTQRVGPNHESLGGFGAKSLAAIVILVAAVMILGAAPAAAQYQVYAWFNFDDGRLDAKALKMGRDAEKRAAVAAYPGGAGAPAGLSDPTSRREIGAGGLLLKTDPNPDVAGHTVGMASNVILQRSRLGKTGRALFQADFYIPPEPERAPSLAVLAMAPLEPGKTAAQTFYRFGIAANRDVYFSLIALGGEATIYKSDQKLFKSLPRGAWHRFAIVCEGETAIRCYVDGREASFSPLQDSSLQNLQVGVLLADKSNSYSAWVDNLSIQWTPEDAPLPDSPWAWTWPGGPPRPGTQVAVAMGGSGDGPHPIPTAATIPAAPAAGVTEWSDPQTGWQRSQASGKPMLVYFMAPRLDSTRQMDQMMQDAAARDFLARHACVKVDVNQLQGGSYAQQFNIYKVPTIILFNSQGQEAGRAVFNKGDTWSSIMAKINKP